MVTPDSVAARLAEHLAGISADRLSDAGRRIAIDAITDTIGVTLAGAHEPAVAIVKQTVLASDGADGAASIFGDRRRGGMLDVALINGTAAHAVDYDDMVSAMGGHPSVPVVPAILALGEARGASGRQVLDAYLVGFEAECRLGRAVHPHHYDRGWHPTSTLGVFGAAAAAGRLLDFDRQKMTTAIALAASHASGIKANFGTMTKPLHAGHSARSGLLSALLVANGFTAREGALEHHQGFFAAYDGLDNVDVEEMFVALDPPLEMEQPGFGVKQFPCCGSTHSAVLAMLALGPRVDPAAIERIEIHAHRRRFPHTDNPDPQSALASKFSVQYAAARALLDGPLRLAHFEGDAFRDPRVRDVMRRITLIPFDRDPHGGDGEMGAEVVIRLRDGTHRSHHVPSAVGRGIANPMSDAEKWAKFSDCYAVALPDSPNMKAAYDAAQDIGNLPGIRDLTALLVPAGE